MAGYDSIPDGATCEVSPFTLHVSDEKIADFKQLLKLSPLASVTFENEQQDRRFGMTRKWLSEAKEHWQNGFDWRNCEKHINSFPNFKAKIEDIDGSKYDVHFVALFSKRKDAVPVAFFHGWPGR